MPESSKKDGESNQLPGIPGRRRNGFEQPFDTLQIATWIIFPFILVHYFSFLYFLIWSALAAKVVLTVIFCLAVICTAYFAYMTCSVDPADDVLCSATVAANTNEKEQIYCYLCEVNVDSSSKHCRFCNKCVKVFDHHCKWLNTCVGRKNYRYFLGIVSSVFIMTGESFALSLAFMIESFAFPDRFLGRVLSFNNFEHFLGSSISIVALQTLLVISTCIMLCIVLLVIQLCGFHIVLLWKGLTTYDFIVNEQKRQREKESARAQKKLEMQNKSSKKTSNSNNPPMQQEKINAKKLDEEEDDGVVDGEEFEQEHDDQQHSGGDVVVADGRNEENV